MATKVWNDGAGDGIFLTAGNWVGGVAPVATDDIVIGTSNRDIAGVATGFAIASLTITPGFGGTIGSGGTPLTFTNITGSVKYAGSGPGMYLGCTGTCAAAEFSHTVGMVYITAGTWTLLTNTYGNFDIGASAVVTTLYNIGGNGTVNYNATAITTCRNSGSLSLKRVVTTMYADRGNTIQQDSGTTATNVGTVLYIGNGATYNKQSSGAETTINIFPGGRFTTDKNTGGSTGSVALGTINKWAGSYSKTTAVPGVTFTYTAFNYVGSVGSASDSI